MMNNRIVLICGPTGIGKTDLSIRLAEKLNGEIVGADSMQIYRRMDIGTAKPTPEERRRIRHHMINVADPDETYDAARFSREAREAVDDILKRGRLPFVVGGTGFYIKALLHGLCDARPEDPDVRERLRREVQVAGGPALYERLCASDPAAAEKIHPNDTYRVIRALEMFEITGKPMSELQNAHRFSDTPYDAVKFVLNTDRTVLYDRINRRVDRMIAEGLLQEVRGLLEMGYDEALRPMQSLGYRHMTDFIRGRTDWETAVETLKRDTRHYAKRQLTWFRKDGEMMWVPPGQEAEMVGRIRRFMN